MAEETRKPDQAASNLNSNEMLGVIDAAIDETAEWQQRWHRAIVCGLTPDPTVVSEYARYLSKFGSWLDLHRNQGLLGQPAFRDLDRYHEAMYEAGRFLAKKAAEGRQIPAAEYDSFTEKVNEFYALARRMREAFRKAVSELDPLTGLSNRQVMMSALAREYERALRTGTPCSIVLADIDHFKSVNDTYGHSAGDDVLRNVANRFLASLRPYDDIYRYGGEEFLICLPNANSKMASEIAERLRFSLQRKPIKLANGTPLDLTASFGLRVLDGDVPLKEAIEQADRALYKAKSDGRNQFVLWRVDLDEMDRNE